MHQEWPEGWPGASDAADLAGAARHAELSAPAAACLAGCDVPSAALARLLAEGHTLDAVRLLAHALPRREAVWWACRCAAHTAPGDLPAAHRAARELAERWVRRQTDDLRRAAMDQAQRAGLDSPEAWAAVAAFWSGDSMAPPGQPKVAPAPHLAGTAAAGSVVLASVRRGAARQPARLDAFLASARAILHGGTGHLAPEA